MQKPLIFSLDKTFFDKVFRKSGSYNSLNGARGVISNLDTFCGTVYQKNTDDLLTEIRETIQENPNDVTPMIFLDKFSSYLQDKKKVQ
jgi:hypothetical protein